MNPPRINELKRILELDDKIIEVRCQLQDYETQRSRLRESIAMAMNSRGYRHLVWNDTVFQVLASNDLVIDRAPYVPGKEEELIDG